MTKRAVPMMHVPDVEAAVNWYKKIGFTVDNTYGNEGDGFSFAILSFGNTKVMFNQGGEPSSAKRREVDLYIYTENVDDLFEQLKDQVDVIDGPHDTFYGMREFVFRDLNRFWITLAQESVFSAVQQAIHDGNVERVRELIARGVGAEALNAGLASVREGQANAGEIKKILQAAGASPPFETDAATLSGYVGKYRDDDFELKVTFQDGRLFAAPGRQEPLSLRALDNTTFTPIYLEDFGAISFNLEGGKTIACTLKQGPHSMQLKRVDEE